MIWTHSFFAFVELPRYELNTEGISYAGLYDKSQLENLVISDENPGGIQFKYFLKENIERHPGRFEHTYVVRVNSIFNKMIVTVNI